MKHIPVWLLWVLATLCLVMFFTFEKTVSGATETVTLGLSFSPWFILQFGSGPGSGFEVTLFSWSWLLLATAVALVMSARSRRPALTRSDASALPGTAP